MQKLEKLPDILENTDLTDRYNPYGVKYVRAGQSIAVGKIVENHSDIAEATKTLEGYTTKATEPKVVVSDGGIAVYDSITRAIILKGLTGSTRVSTLIPFRQQIEDFGYMRDKVGFYAELERLREETAQIMSEILGMAVLAHFEPNDEHVFPAPIIHFPQVITPMLQKKYPRVA